MKTSTYILSCACVTLLACGGSGIGTNNQGNDNGNGTADGGVDSDSGQDSDGGAAPAYRVVDTGQVSCFDDTNCTTCTDSGAAFFGQDTQYDGNAPSYQDNGDGTVTDLVTGLMWQQDPGDKRSYADAVAGAASADTGGYDDWRVPTIKELYSLIQFTGQDPDPTSTSTADLTPFIDDSAFGFEYGDTSSGDRIIDSQWVTRSIYTSTVMSGEECFFGVNFADGRIKCYPTRAGGNNGYFVIYVRGNAQYGVNSFTDNGDGTVSDASTGLTWMQDDNGQGVNWQSALSYCENLSLAGHDDWRLPNAKELQSLVDYSRSPDYTQSPAIDPIFNSTGITNEAGQADWPFYWTSTTHKSASGSGASGVYVAFGRALGDMGSGWIDVHGAGAQRSDPKDGDPSDYPQSHGPQGDVLRVFNYVRCVRSGVATPSTAQGATCDTGSTDPTEPVPCNVEADCDAVDACPSDAALGCTCQPTPQGDNACVPECQTTADCPESTDVTLECGPQGFCVPTDGP